MEEPENEVNEPANSLLKRQTVVDETIECIGCPIFLLEGEIYAQHLLLECILPKNSNNSENLRTKVTQWLLRYFYAHYVETSTNKMTNANDPGRAPKRKHVKSGPTKVELQRIPFDLQCPVCEKYFGSHNSCLKHLFENCLRTRNSVSAIHILDWFSNYLRINSESKLDCIRDLDQFQKVSKRCVCNYCTKEFLSKEYMLNHFRASHHREVDGRESVCCFCNLKVGSDGQLFRHLMKTHVRCGCMERQKDFDTLETHLRGCPKSDGCLCPICQDVKVRTYDTEAEFERHILNCRRPIPIKYSPNDLFSECDICWQKVLKCNIVVHVAGHVKSIDAARRQPRNTYVNFNDLKDVLSEKELVRMEQLFQ